MVAPLAGMKSMLEIPKQKLNDPPFDLSAHRNLIQSNGSPRPSVFNENDSTINYHLDIKSKNTSTENEKKSCASDGLEEFIVQMRKLLPAAEIIRLQSLSPVEIQSGDAKLARLNDQQLKNLGEDVIANLIHRSCGSSPIDLFKGVTVDENRLRARSRIASLESGRFEELLQCVFVEINSRIGNPNLSLNFNQNPDSGNHSSSCSASDLSNLLVTMGPSFQSSVNSESAVDLGLKLAKFNFSTSILSHDEGVTCEKSENKLRASACVPDAPKSSAVDVRVNTNVSDNVTDHEQLLPQNLPMIPNNQVLPYDQIRFGMLENLIARLDRVLNSGIEPRPSLAFECYNSDVNFKDSEVKKKGIEISEKKLHQNMLELRERELDLVRRRVTILEEEIVPELKIQLKELNVHLQQEKIISEKKTYEISQLMMKFQEKSAEVEWYQETLSRVVSLSASIDDLASSKPASFAASSSLHNLKNEANFRYDTKLSPMVSDLQDVQAAIARMVAHNTSGTTFAAKYGEFLAACTGEVDKLKILDICKEICIIVQKGKFESEDESASVDSWFRGCKLYADCLEMGRPIDLMSLLVSLENLSKIIKMSSDEGNEIALFNESKDIAESDQDKGKKNMDNNVVQNVIDGFNVFGAFILQSGVDCDENSLIKLPDDVAKTIYDTLIKAMDICEYLGSVGNEKDELKKALEPVRDALQIKTENTILIRRPFNFLLEPVRLIISILRGLTY